MNIEGCDFLDNVAKSGMWLVTFHWPNFDLNERTQPMNKTIRNLAIAALFIFPGLSGFPQGVQLDEAPLVEAAQMFGGNVFLSHTILIP